MQTGFLYIAYSDVHGRGVFTARDIEAGEVIEICPVILFPKSELPFIRQTILDNYYFDWGDDDQWYAIALGYGSLYNHSYEPNAEYDMDFDAQTIDFHAIKCIPAGTEILVNYNGFPDDTTQVWFEKEAGRSAEK